MRLPRDISGHELARLLNEYGYTVTRQTGSHIRLTTQQNCEHHVTISAHKELRLGTLSAILTDVADLLGSSREDLAETLFGK